MKILCRIFRHDFQPEKTQHPWGIIIRYVCKRCGAKAEVKVNE